MQMRLPVHVWAMLTRGREAVGSITFYSGPTERVRWREYDGERCWKSSSDGIPYAAISKNSVTLRIVWMRLNGRWHLELWEGCVDEEWSLSWTCEVGRRVHDMGEVSRRFTAVPSPGGCIPQEILLHMLQQFDRVCTATSFDTQAAHLALKGWPSRSLLAAVSGTCRAWFAICAPELYRWTHVRSARISELMEDLSKQGSHKIGRAHV